MNEIVNVPEERTIDVVTTEIQILQRQAQQMVLDYAIEIGRRLTEAKTMLPHGAWGEWLRDKVKFSKSTANNMMRIFEEYGAAQIGIFGAEAKNQTLGSLSYTKALRLLAIPEEDREDFVKENNVDELSTRELDRLIKERDEARAGEKAANEAKAAAEAAKQDAEKRAGTAEAAADRLISQKQELERANKKELDRLREDVKAANAKAEDAAAQVTKAQADLERARKSADTAKDKLKKLQENPVPEDTLAKIRADAAVAAEKSATEKLDAQTREAEKRVRDAESAAEEARLRAEKAEKKLALADEDTILFKAQFSRFQEEFNKCSGLLMKVEINNPETATKLRKAMEAVLDNMKGQL